MSTPTKQKGAKAYRSTYIPFQPFPRFCRPPTWNPYGRKNHVPPLNPQILRACGVEIRTEEVFAPGGFQQSGAAVAYDNDIETNALL